MDLDISAQVILEQRNSDTDWRVSDMMPDWAEQWNRCIAPCNSAASHEWLRKSPVITLGELFQRLGTAHTAKTIYGFYRTRRLVVLKKRKTQSNPAGPPGSASGGPRSRVTGLTGSPLQAAAIRAELANARNPTHG